MTDLNAIKDAPRDGTRILIYVDDYDVFVGYWGWAGRYTNSVKAWIGHELGYHQDNDVAGWLPIPDVTTS